MPTLPTMHHDITGGHLLDHTQLPLEPQKTSYSCFFSTRAEELLSTCKHTCTGWFVLVSATQLKPDEGTPELPEGRVRVRLQTDGSLHDVTEYEIEKVHQCFSLNVTFISVVSSED